MAQLIKLQDYVSRYEKDIYHYPGQFMRLKKDNWRNVEQEWQYQMENRSNSWFDEDSTPESTKGKSFFQDFDQREEPAIPLSKEKLKQNYLDNLLPFQLKWASTTVNEMSFFDQYFYDDLKLKYFLQRFPDIFLLLYHPIFNLKNNPMEGDILLVSPLELEIIHFVEYESSASLVVGNDRTWYIERNNIQKSMLSPMVSMNRTDQVIKSIFKKYKLDFPVRKVVLSRTNHIKFQTEPYNTRFIGLDSHEQWLNEKRRLVSPIKHQQLKICDHLLKHCFTNAIKRPEWDEEAD